MDVETRKHHLRKSGRCFICLRRYHVGRNCRSNAKCHLCKGRHHVSICDRTQKDGRTTDPVAPTSGAAGSSVPPTLSMYASARTLVLLQTARIEVFHPENPNVSLDVRVIFDCGSQRSYVTERLKNSFNLPVTSVDTLVIRTFGSSEERIQRCEVVDLSLRARNGEPIQLSFLTVPLICEPLASQPLRHAIEMFPYLIWISLTREVT